MLAPKGFTGEIITLGGPNRLGVIGAAGFALPGVLAGARRFAAGVDGKNGLNLNLASNWAGRATTTTGRAGEGREGDVVKLGFRTGDVIVRWRAGDVVEVVKIDLRDRLGDDEIAAEGVVGLRT